MSEEGREERELGDAGARRAAGSPSTPVAADVFDAMPVGAALFGPDGGLRHANPVLVDLLGVPLDRLRGRSLAALVEPADRDLVEELLVELVAGQRNSFECLLAVSPAALSGLSWSIRAYVAPAYGGGGGVEGLVLQVFDFRPAGAPPPLPAGLAEVLEEGSDFLLTAGPDGHLTYANRSARDVLGVQLLGGEVRLEDVFDAASLELYRDAVEPRVVAEGSWQGELTLRTRQGRAVPVSARLVAHRSGGSADTGPTAPRSISLFARDITEIKTAERKLRQLATHDYLTGLPNRLLLYDRLELALNRYARYGTPVALMFCDLDGFKPVNDVYGHQVGDAVLTEVADRIHSVVRDTDTAARLGGDEFAVLVEGVDDIDMLTVVAGRLVDAIAQPVRVNGTTAQVGVSIGIVVASPQCQEPDAMVAAADSAMYRAKDEGRGRFHLWTGDEEPIGGLGRDG